MKILMIILVVFLTGCTVTTQCNRAGETGRIGEAKLSPIKIPVKALYSYEI